VTAPNAPTRVLVAYASRMGSTAEIAEAIAERLRAFGLEVSAAPCDQAPEPGGFDAVVCGSAIYASRWDMPARHFVRANKASLAQRPTWLFESGPCGNLAEQRHETSRFVLRLAAEVGCQPPKVFGGNLDPARAKSRVSRWVANSDLAGDYRNWDDIRAWADGIARSLSAKRV
jgi:menaquinone-dependent protoporphyrinogen oxidase